MKKQLSILAQLTNQYLSGHWSMLLNTSGSTGDPKRWTTDLYKIRISADATINFFGLTSQTVILHCLPAQYVGGMMQWMRGLILQSDIVILEPKENLNFSSATLNADFAALTPSQAFASSNQLVENMKKHGQIILGGGEVTRPVKEHLSELPLKFYEVYGMTETYSHVAAKSLGSECYQSMLGVDIKPDEEGRITISGAITDDTLLITNDIYEECGGGFKLAGRADWIINSGGLKINPIIWEKELREANSKLGDFIIAPAKDEKYGQKLVIVTQSPSAEEREWKSALASVQWKPAGIRPRDIYTVPAFEKTPTGKWKRGAIAELALAHSPVFRLS